VTAIADRFELGVIVPSAVCAKPFMVASKLKAVISFEFAAALTVGAETKVTGPRIIARLNIIENIFFIILLC
jgi:hypothetical protein